MTVPVEAGALQDEDMSKVLPANKDGFNRNRERMLRPSLLHGVDALFKLECEIILAYYYGSYVRAGWHLFWHGINAALHSQYWKWIFRSCDWIGWTRLQAIPNTAYFERHSSKCDKINCDDMNCVSSGIPNWFKKLTRMRE